MKIMKKSIEKNENLGKNKCLKKRNFSKIIVRK